MKKPTVTCICPLSPQRMEDQDKVVEIFHSQTYKRTNLLIAADENNIGTKRNNLVKMAKGDIIVCLDSDDWYASDWVERAVDFLRSNTNVAITGLSRAYFNNGTERRIWEYNGSKAHVCEASMAFWRKIWGGTKMFGNTSHGEGQQFLMGNGKIIPHNYIDGFEARIHGKNTSSHLSWDKMKVV